MKRIMMMGQFNSITQNIYRSLLNRFHVQFCPPVEDFLKDEYQLLEPDLMLVSMVGMNEEQVQMFYEWWKSHAGMPAVCVGNQEELRLLGSDTDGERLVRLVRPVTIRDIIENISRLLNMKLDINSNSAQKRNQKKRILIIDDSAIQLRTMRELLRGEFEVDMAKSGQEAIQMIYKHTPDMIFLDYDMPECDGRMTFEMIKNEPVSRDVPVVFLTGINERKKVLSVLNMLPADYLLKPVDKKKIMETISEVIGL